MNALRRHLVATACVTLAVQTLVLALGTATMCSDAVHTHGGVPAPECPMHHQVQADTRSMQGHSHHGHATASNLADHGGQRITCRCSNDLTSLYLGQTAILQVPAPWSPFVPAVTLDPASDPSVVAPLFSPPSPPPR